MNIPTVILPKHPSITSVYVADTMESESDLNEFSQTCEQSLTWRGKDSQLQTWLRRAKRMKWMRLLFSRTLKRSHTTSFVDAWTYYLRASHANPFPVVANDNQPTTNDTSTLGSQMELPLAKLDSCCSKTLKGSSPQKQETENQYLNMSSETWKKEVTRVRGAWLQRMKLERHIEESESSSLQENWATPDASLGGHARGPNSKQKCLVLQMRAWATPQASDHVEGARTRVDSGQKCLGRDLNQMSMFPTIRSQEPGRTTKGYGRGLAELVEGKEQIDPASPPIPTNDNTIGKNREQLSPNWVEQLMGVPVGLTQLPTELID